MPIVEFSNLNKHGNIRTRRFWQEKSSLGINPNKFGSYIEFRLFKYKYVNRLPPSFTTIKNKRYVMPGWQEVIHGTTLEDIDWIKPKVKRAEIFEYTSKSSSSDKVYTTKEHVATDGSRKYSCSCPGAWRAKDRRCTHIISLEK